MELRPQDVVVVLKLVATGRRDWTYAQLGKELALSASQVFRSVERAEFTRLLSYAIPPPPGGTSLLPAPERHNLKEFLAHGVRYVFPVQHGSLVRGIPTAYAAPPLSQQLGQSNELPPVWPHPKGAVRGFEFSPLYKNVPQAVLGNNGSNELRDPKLYELLALVDAIRDGRAREREIAIRELTARIDAL